jgi:hypothetical protein
MCILMFEKILSLIKYFKKNNNGTPFGVGVYKKMCVLIKLIYFIQNFSSKREFQCLDLSL